jgi:cell division protein FtsI/penicillin-binding protein 2
MTEFEQRNIRILSVIVLLIGAFFIARLYFLQVVYGEEYRKAGERQYVATVPHLFDRGEIFFQEKDGKRVSAATIESGYLLTIDPTKITEPEKVYERLSEIVELDRERFLRQAQKPGVTYAEVAEHISAQDAERIKALQIPGVRLYLQSWRSYPARSLAARTIGFIAYDGDHLVGRYGVERFYEDTLVRAEKELYLNFFAELFTNLRQTLFDGDTSREGDVVLTIEPKVQAYVETELAGVMREWRSEESGAVVIDPRDGRIIAMAVDPSFDLNAFKDVDDPRLYTNPIVENVYEMGSIMKPITIAAGLDSGVITPHSTYNDTGRIILNTKTISNYDGRGRGPGTTMQMVLSQSLNTGVAYVVSRMGQERFAEYFLRRFKIGEETGIDLPNEVQGLVRNLESKREVEYATASFGQGIAITPINMVQALCVLANGGTLITPHVVDRIVTGSGERQLVPNPSPRVISATTSEEITRMLVEVVDKALLGGTVRIPEYSIAAKTGTAQIARPRELGGGYYDDRYLHTFFGYFPAYDPQFLVFLYTYHPKGAEYASHTLTHPFMRITKFLLNYYAIPPDRDPTLATARSINLP